LLKNGSGVSHLSAVFVMIKTSQNMRTKAAYIITLITDITESTEIAGKLEVVKNGESVNFCNWDELKTLIIENLVDDDISSKTGGIRSRLSSGKLDSA
jgi:hypothetical protein